MPFHHKNSTTKCDYQQDSPARRGKTGNRRIPQLYLTVEMRMLPRYNRVCSIWFVRVTLMNRKTIMLGWMRIVFGLAVFALGVHLTIRADLGVAPWDCLGLGIAGHTPLNYGLSMTAMAVVILLIDILMKEKIGFGTVIDALLTGNFVQLFNDLDPFPETAGVFSGILIIFAGLVLMALGQWLYMSSAQCCGPRDALLVGLGKRLSRLPIGAVQVMLWGTVLLLGWLLGGPVGIGTVVSTFGSGAVMQVVFSLIGFEPRKVEHHGVIETAGMLREGQGTGVSG